ncbi:MAG TPA: class I SAM-dependent methyltransferase [Acidimicrobiales bacterium]|nr:class I SAM-dependent methyltransferase [Acidimicrobiales bacterium]
MLTDPRLASLYDIDNPDGPDHDHWRRLADQVEPLTIIDLGCGTGLLTVSLASVARRTIGIDPDAGMLAVARRRPEAENVEWRLGDSRAIEESGVELVLMTGNVAQHVGPRHWPGTLEKVSAALSPGGVLGFETRNPDARAWRGWTPEATCSTRETLHGKLTEWLEATEPDQDGTVILTAHNLWSESGEDLVVEQPLTFRGLEELVEDLAAAGLSVRAVHGGWDGEQFNAASALIVLTAEKIA